MRTTTIKDYTPFGYIVYEEHSPHKIVCGSGLPIDIARYAKLHNLDAGKCWISFRDGVYEVTSAEQYAMDHKHFIASLRTIIDNLNGEQQI